MRTLLFEKYIESNIMTMRELAARLGYSAEYLSRIRHGHVPIKTEFVGRVCVRLGHDIGDLFLPDVSTEEEGIGW